MIADENSVINNIIAGDTEQYRILVDDYYEAVYNIILTIVHNHHTAEDLAQETFIRAFKKIAKFQRKSRFYTWLYRITVNSALNYLKSAKREAGNLCFSNEGVLTAVENHTPPKDIEYKETKEQINCAVNQLSVKLRTVISLSAFQQMSLDEIAEILAVDKKTVTWRLFEARRLIRKYLKKI